MKNSTNRRLTQDGLLAIVYLSGSKELLDVSISENNDEYNHNIFKASKYSQTKNSYGPVLSEIERGHQLTTGGIV